MQYTITKDIMKVLENQRRSFEKLWQQRNFWWNRWTKNRENIENFDYFLSVPNVYLLAGTPRHIKYLIPFQAKYAGCIMMRQILPDEFGQAISMVPIGAEYLGIARVGAFHTDSYNNMREIKRGLSIIKPDSIFLSCGRNGYLLETPITARYIRRLKLKVVR